MDAKPLSLKNLLLNREFILYGLLYLGVELERNLVLRMPLGSKDNPRGLEPGSYADRTKLADPDVGRQKIGSTLSNRLVRGS